MNLIRTGNLGRWVNVRQFDPVVIQGVRNQEDHKCGHNREGKWRGTWHVVKDTEKIECRVRRRHAEVDGNIKVFQRNCQKRVRKDGDEVPFAERAAVTSHALPVNGLTATGHTER